MNRNEQYDARARCMAPSSLCRFPSALTRKRCRRWDISGARRPGSRASHRSLRRCQTPMRPCHCPCIGRSFHPVTQRCRQHLDLASITLANRAIIGSLSLLRWLRRQCTSKQVELGRASHVGGSREIRAAQPQLYQLWYRPTMNME